MSEWIDGPPTTAGDYKLLLDALVEEGGVGLHAELPGKARKGVAKQIPVEIEGEARVGPEGFLGGLPVGLPDLAGLGADIESGERVAHRAIFCIREFAVAKERAAEIEEDGFKEGFGHDAGG